MDPEYLLDMLEELLSSEYEIRSKNNRCPVSIWLYELISLIHEVTDLLSEVAWGRQFGLYELENPGSKIDREDVFKISCNKNHVRKLLCNWETLDSQEELCRKEPLSQEPQMSLRWKSLIFTGTDYQMIGLLRALGECSQNHFTAPSRGRLLTSMNKVKQMNSTGNRFYPDSNESCVVDIDLMEVFDWDGKMTLKVRWFDRNVLRDPMFKHGDTHRTILQHLLECPQNHFTAPSRGRLLTSMNKVKQMNNTGNRFYPDSNESCVVDIDLMEAFDWDGKMTLKVRWFDRNVPRDPMFKHGDTFNQHKRKKILQCISSFVVSTIAFLGIVFNLWSQFSIIQVQPLHREHPASIWSPFLGLLGFMVFVWAVGTMILVGAPFTRMQRAMFVFWAILMLLDSADSISAVFVPILGILFMGWFALGKVTTK